MSGDLTRCLSPLPIGARYSVDLSIQIINGPSNKINSQENLRYANQAHSRRAARANRYRYQPYSDNRGDVGRGHKQRSSTKPGPWRARDHGKGGESSESTVSSSGPSGRLAMKTEKRSSYHPRLSVIWSPLLPLRFRAPPRIIPKSKNVNFDVLGVGDRVRADLLQLSTFRTDSVIKSFARLRILTCWQ